MEDAAPELQHFPQLGGIGQVPVVGQGHAALAVVDEQGLGVEAAVGAGGGVAHVAHGDVALSQGFQAGAVEDLSHQARVPPGAEDPVVVQGDAGALLAPVLQGVEPVVGQARQVPLLRGPEAQHAAFLPGTVSFTHPLSPAAP